MEPEAAVARCRRPPHPGAQNWVTRLNHCSLWAPHLPWSQDQGRGDALFPKGLHANPGNCVLAQAHDHRHKQGSGAHASPLEKGRKQLHFDHFKRKR